jgi:hypothetical protein
MQDMMFNSVAHYIFRFVIRLGSAAWFRELFPRKSHSDGNAKVEVALSRASATETDCHDFHLARAYQILSVPK